MTNQFVVPDHNFPEHELFSREHFRSVKRNIKNENMALGETARLLPMYSDDLISNLVTPEQHKAYSEGRKIILSKKFTFACAHALPYHKGKCQYLHGHEWEIEVFLIGAINNEGMLLDFSDLKKAVNENFIDIVDHGYLNALLPNPTAENIAYYIWNVLQFKAYLKGIHCIQVWETPTSCATLTIDLMSDYSEGMWAWKI